MRMIRPPSPYLMGGRGLNASTSTYLGKAFQRQARVRDELETSLLHEPVFRALPHPCHDGLHPTFGFLELSIPLVVDSLSPSHEKQDAIFTESHKQQYQGNLTRRSRNKHPTSRATLSPRVYFSLQGRPFEACVSVLIERVDR